MLKRTNLLSKRSFQKELWASGSFQQKNSITRIEQLERWIELTDEEKNSIRETSLKYKWRVTPYYADLMDKQDPNCPIRLQAIPHSSEMRTYKFSDEDSVGDTENLKTSRIVHKYPNRVVFLVTDICPVYCRHCTRKAHTTDPNSTYFGENVDYSYEADFEYLRNNKEITDVLLTGGDPLSLNDDKLEHIISNLRKINHIEVIRLGSRFPVLLPQRITSKFSQMLKKYHPIWFNTHFNHPKEITQDSIQAINNLIDAGIFVQNQSVLLKGINDDVEIMRRLNRELLKIRVRPYYLYHCDNITGVSHFRTTVAKGSEILKGLYGYETGFSVPQYVITTKLGKMAVSTDSVSFNEDKILINNYKGKTEDITDYLRIEE